MQEIHQGSVELEKDTIDVEDIEQSYETGLDDSMYQTDEAPPINAGAPNAAPPPPPA